MDVPELEEVGKEDITRIVSPSGLIDLYATCGSTYS